MELKLIKSIDSPEFTKVWEIYKEAFPIDEQRSREEQEKTLKSDEYHLGAIIEKSKILGLIGFWNIPPYIFIEHFAIHEKIRNKGIGTQFITNYQKNKKIILEAERPTDTRTKRINNFWKKNGYYMNTQNYIQPAYDSTKKPVHMYLQTYPEKLTEKEFTIVRDLIHKKVYGLSKPLIK